MPILTALPFIRQATRRAAGTADRAALVTEVWPVPELRAETAVLVVPLAPAALAAAILLYYWGRAVQVLAALADREALVVLALAATVAP